MIRGKFITVEGLDGAGKSTQIDRIASILLDSGVPVVVTREPGGTEIGEKLRNLILGSQHEIDPVTEVMIMFAARNEHYTKVINPALSSGNWVICDRFTDSSYAYQGGGRGVDISVIAQLERLTHDQAQPDLTLYFDIQVRVAMERMVKCGVADYFEQRSWEFFQRVRNSFLERSKMFSDRIKVINANSEVHVVSDRVEAEVLKFVHQSINGMRGITA